MKKSFFFSFVIGLVAGIGTGPVASAQSAQVVTNSITGTVTFNNSSPALLNLLNPPGNDGMSNLYIYAYSVPTGRSSVSGWQSTGTRISGTYDVVVDCDTNGIAYSLTPVAWIANGEQTYWFTSKTSAPVVADVSGPAVNFSECVGAVQLHFVTTEGAPVAVTSGHGSASRLSDGSASSLINTIPTGASQYLVYLEGGETHSLILYLNRGLDPYTDRQVYFVMTNVTVLCDQVVDVNIAFPPTESLGTIAGQVDMLGEFEWSVPGYRQDQTIYPDYTTVMANFGPFQNERWDALPGDNLITPSSGAFNLINVAPSTTDPNSPGYAVSALMLFRSERRAQYFGTPGLGWGSNAAVVVTPGSSVNLSNTFVIDPGYLRGEVLLKGPTELPGHKSLFRGLLHAGDNDLDGDGIPDAAGTYGIYYSSVAAEGVDRRATGARYTAAHGYGYGDFAGDFDPITSSYRGDYELVLGGLLGEASVWKYKYLTLALSSGTVTNDDDYYYNNYSIEDRTTSSSEINPGQATTHDLAYCFSEVRVRFHSDTANFYSPQIRFYDGIYTNADFQGNPANYVTGSGLAFGTPVYQYQATNRGQVVMYLPQGKYTLFPSVVPADSIYALTGLEPIVLNVPCAQRIALEPCLQMALNIPGCYSSTTLALAGSVRTLCTNRVARITYELNGGAPVTICNDCGLNPDFGFTVNLESGDNRLKITAYDDRGGITSVESDLRPDNLPPTIQCPDDLTVDCNADGGAVVNFTVNAADTCDPNVMVTCNPPPGSVFPVGETVVHCTATDSAGNSSECSFKVIVNPSKLTIERAVIVRWNCGGTLQYADDLAGPWVDIPGATSPYSVSASEAHRYYRSRQ